MNENDYLKMKKALQEIAEMKIGVCNVGFLTRFCTKCMAMQKIAKDALKKDGGN